MAACNGPLSAGLVPVGLQAVQQRSKEKAQAMTRLTNSALSAVVPMQGRKPTRRTAVTPRQMILA